MAKINVEPSTLPVEVANDNLDLFIKNAVKQNVDGIHFDVIDGIFAPDKAMPISLAKKLKKSNQDVNISVHLMAKNAKKYVNKFLKINPQTIFFHIESCKHAVDAIKLLNKIKSQKVFAGIAIDLDTSITDELLQVLKSCDAVLVMSVKTGKSGQPFDSKALDKIKLIRENNKSIKIYIDGGINNKTFKKAIIAGATTLCVGSYLYNLVKSNNASEFLSLVN